ncbi:hypothetical protein N7G274_002058 [Stereocaulon virgatum]|uniref:Uncharacterized protein n=1 Tax=Stereocaulon virgatum TaxID=373712 RepID=A0ABR4AKB7_9LECA
MEMKFWGVWFTGTNGVLKRKDWQRMKEIQGRVRWRWQIQVADCRLQIQTCVNDNSKVKIYYRCLSINQSTARTDNIQRQVAYSKRTKQSPPHNLQSPSPFPKNRNQGPIDESRLWW